MTKQVLKMTYKGTWRILKDEANNYILKTQWYIQGNAGLKLKTQTVGKYPDLTAAMAELTRIVDRYERLGERR